MYETKRQFMCACVGVVFSSAWWMFISGVWYNQKISYHADFKGYETLPGIGATIAFIMINFIDVVRVIGPDRRESICVDRFIKFWFYFWVMIFFVCGGGALWVWIKFYWGTWTGLSIFLQVLLIMIDAIAFLIFRSMIR